VLRLAGVVIAVGLADSLNPSTVGPALYLATTSSRVARLLLFTFGVFALNLVAGVALTVGPGRLLLGLIPHPRQNVKHVIEIVAGVVLVGVAIVVWRHRRRLAHRELPMQSGRGGSALVAGVSIAAIELPTAVPYLAVIAAIAASSANLPETVVLIALYCVAFVAPLLAIVVILLVAGERADPMLRSAGAWLQREWPVVVAGLLLLVGGGLTIAGAVGLV
jgi:cytochrome c biogenesis protein CcdA